MSGKNNEGELLHMTAGALEDIVGTFDRTFEGIFEESVDGMFDIISEGLFDCCNAKFTNGYFDGISAPFYLNIFYASLKTKKNI